MSLSVLLAVAFVGAALYYVCPLRFRWVLLLLLSYGFYLTCGVSALPFILITTLTTWAGALKIGRIGESGKAYLHEHKAELTAEEKKARKAKTRSAQRIWFFAVLLLNFGVLAVLKYLNPVRLGEASLTARMPRRWGWFCRWASAFTRSNPWLSHRRLQRQIRAGKEPGEVCAVRLLLSAAHSRPDRAL